ncbi:IS1182 family transposase [Croceicoccus hydrothermalis]|uniref:IS1182 family transposase n=1 Tax=Croceicoccus hydrothermalis TaxID=2867964 RepID=UPI001EFB8C96|nr:IS1182 family transposase [Croceicoccus hydrothermalis]
MMGSTCAAGRSGTGSRMIEPIVPEHHLLRRVDRLLDLAELRGHLASHYSARGRPSIDPELLIRMALIGRIYAIGSERRLCEEVRYNIAYRWFCRLPIGAPVPHHSTFSKNRHGRFREVGVFRVLFEATVRCCMAEGLVAANDAAIDASFVAADASWQRKMRDGDLADPHSRPVREWLQDEAVAVKTAGPRREAPAQISRTDPAAAWAARGGRAKFGYAFNLLIDTPVGVAIEVEATPARSATEVDAGQIMLTHAAQRFGFRPKRVAADTAYGGAPFLAFVIDHGTVPHVPVLERSGQSKGKFLRHAFQYNSNGDHYICPEGKRLAHITFHQPTNVHRYRARSQDCLACPSKCQCTSSSHRTLARLHDEDARDMVRREMQTGLYLRSMRLRRGVERTFADAKIKRGLTRLHLRGIRGAEEEFLLTAAVSNLLLLARRNEPSAKRRRVRRAFVRPSVMTDLSRAAAATTLG